MESDVAATPVADFCLNDVQVHDSNPDKVATRDEEKMREKLRKTHSNLLFYFRNDNDTLIQLPSHLEEIWIGSIFYTALFFWGIPTLLSHH